MLLPAVGVVPGSTVMRNYVDCLEVSYEEVNSLHAGYSLCFLSPADFVFKIKFFKKYFQNTIGVSNSLHFSVK